MSRTSALAKRLGGELQLLIATKNPGKSEELRALLYSLPEINLHSLLEFPAIEAVDETGSSYSENAILKARFYSTITGMWAMADDSGLEVDALDGAPGVRSARYAGKDATDMDRVRLLLARLSELKGAARRARFRSAVAVADENGRILNVAEGSCEGTIAFEPRGHNGFGYDPIFVPSGYNNTFAELPAEVKDSISHRGKALRLTRDFLIGYLAELDRSSGAS
ncbi:MAG TPA: RdgB/HAM1 family non-canonical purine NTP pyrophosphatase [Pyrinomonadaceae bacterium]|nr:RdgB/HAM1 family non-canonical purine NTP pyrophosphatase [Pyrinomonadaceae bacterium]